MNEGMRRRSKSELGVTIHIFQVKNVRFREVKSWTGMLSPFHNFPAFFSCLTTYRNVQLFHFLLASRCGPHGPPQKICPLEPGDCDYLEKGLCKYRQGLAMRSIRPTKEPGKKLSEKSDRKPPCRIPADATGRIGSE